MTHVIGPDIRVKKLNIVTECLYPIVGQSITARMRSTCRDDEGHAFYIRRVDRTNTSKDIEIYHSRFPALNANGKPVAFDALQWNLQRSTWQSRLERVVARLMGASFPVDPLTALSAFIRNRKIIIIVGEKTPRGDTIRYITFPPSIMTKGQTLAEYTLSLWKAYVAKQIE